jgi:hypothetical protein
MDIDPCDMGYVHPTHDNALRWARRKWKVMRKQSLALRRIFGEQKSRDSTTPRCTRRPATASAR